MTHEEIWNEQKEWLRKSIEHLKERKNQTIDYETENKRISAKLEGLKIAYDRMIETEKMYKI